jgi:hypothetical protein
MNSVVEDIRNMLEQESSLGLILGENLFLYREPAKPNNCVTLFEVPGMQPIILLDSNEDTKHYEKPSLNIRVRNTTAEDAYSLSYQITEVLHARAQEIWGDYLYSCIYSTIAPFQLDWDENNRIRISLNFNIQRRLI